MIGGKGLCPIIPSAQYSVQYNGYSSTNISSGVMCIIILVAQYFNTKDTYNLEEHNKHPKKFHPK